MDYKAGQVVYCKGIFNRIHEVEIVKIKERKKYHHSMMDGSFYIECEFLVRSRKNGKLKIVNENKLF